jgi:DNA repair exonuclease SbcCD ATPase subunit
MPSYRSQEELIRPPKKHLAFNKTPNSIPGRLLRIEFVFSIALPTWFSFIEGSGLHCLVRAIFITTMAPAIIPAENPALPGQRLEMPIRDILDVAEHLKSLRTARARTGPSEIDNAIRTISGVQATIKELEDGYVTLCDEQRKHRDLQETAATSLKRIVEERLGEIGDLDGKHTKLESDIQNLRVEKARRDAGVQSLTKSKERLVQSVKELELEKVTKQGKFESLKGEVEKKANELRDLTSKVGDLGKREKEIKEKEDGHERMEKELATRDKEYTEEAARLDKLRSAIGDSETELRTNREKLGADTTTANRVILLLQQTGDGGGKDQPVGSTLEDIELGVKDLVGKLSEGKTKAIELERSLQHAQDDLATKRDMSIQLRAEKYRAERKQMRMVRGQRSWKRAWSDLNGRWRPRIRH